jgi:hypothetical protein
LVAGDERHLHDDQHEDGDDRQREGELERGLPAFASASA